MKILMIRHGATLGNDQGRYVGRTDEGITEETVAKLRKQYKDNYDFYQQISRVFVSPMLRCRQTAEILFPGIHRVIVENFKECDFGDFEYKNYSELNGNTEYQAFIDSNGELGFPKGETKKQFQDRCVRAFCQVMEDYVRSSPLKGEDTFCEIALVVHGGTIMSILDALSRPHRDYYDWHLGNGEGLLMDIIMSQDNLILENMKRLVDR